MAIVSGGLGLPQIGSIVAIGLGVSASTGNVVVRPSPAIISVFGLPPTVQVSSFDPDVGITVATAPITVLALAPLIYIRSYSAIITVTQTDSNYSSSTRLSSLTALMRSGSGKSEEGVYSLSSATHHADVDSIAVSDTLSSLYLGEVISRAGTIGIDTVLADRDTRLHSINSVPRFGRVSHSVRVHPPTAVDSIAEVRRSSDISMEKL